MDALKGLITDESVKQEVLGRFMGRFVKPMRTHPWS
jgi:hypothetical protein